MDQAHNHDSGFASEFEGREPLAASSRQGSARIPSYSTTDATKRDVEDEHSSLHVKHDMPFESDIGLGFRDERNEIGASTTHLESPSERVPQTDIRGGIVDSQVHQPTQTLRPALYIPSASLSELPTQLTDVPHSVQLQPQPQSRVLLHQPPSGLPPVSAAQQYQYGPLSSPPLNAYSGPSTSANQNSIPSMTPVSPNQNPQISDGSSDSNADRGASNVHNLLAEILRTGSQQVHKEVYHLLSQLQVKANQQAETAKTTSIGFARDTGAAAIGGVGEITSSSAPDTIGTQAYAPHSNQPSVEYQTQGNHRSILSDINTVLRPVYLGVAAETEKKLVSYADSTGERLETGVERKLNVKEGRHPTATWTLKESAGILKDAYNLNVQPGVGQQSQVAGVGPNKLQVRPPDPAIIPTTGRGFIKGLTSDAGVYPVVVASPVEVLQPVYANNSTMINVGGGTAVVGGVGARSGAESSTGKRSSSYSDGHTNKFQTSHRDERYPASFQQYLNQTQIQTPSRMGDYTQKGSSSSGNHVSVPVYEAGGYVGDEKDDGAGEHGKEKSNGHRKHLIDWIVPVITFFSGREPEEEKIPPKKIIPNSVWDRLCYTRKCAVEQERKYRRKARTTGFLLNTAIATQLFLSAIVTGLSASNTSRHAVSVLGGLGTGVSGYIAHHRGSGEPDSSVIIVNDLQKFIRDIDGFMNDYGDLDGHLYDDQILAFRERLEKLLGNATENDDALKAKAQRSTVPSAGKVAEKV